MAMFKKIKFELSYKCITPFIFFLKRWFFENKAIIHDISPLTPLTIGLPLFIMGGGLTAAAIVFVYEKIKHGIEKS